MRNVSADLVSVIVPIYNEERFLDDCIHSIIFQSYKNLQIILVDDGSKEIVASKCDRYAESDDRIFVIHIQNSGLSMARLSGFGAAVGKWIMFVDDDDVLPLCAVEHLLTGYRFDVDIIAGKRVDLINVDSYNKTQTDEIPKCNVYRGTEVCECLGMDKQETIITPLWGKLYRKDFLDKLDLHEHQEKCPTIFFEDVLMTPILYAKAMYISLIDTVVYIHREVETSISRCGKLSAFYFEQIESGNILLEFCIENDLKHLYSYELKLYYLTLLRTWCLLEHYPMKRTTKNSYKNSIVTYYKKYLKDYMVKSSESLLKKCLIFLFGFSKKLWGKIVYIIYYSKKVSERSIF